LLLAATVIMVSSLVWLELSREAQAKVSDWIRINWYTVHLAGATHLDANVLCFTNGYLALTLSGGS
jgi:hypothetical protein